MTRLKHPFPNALQKRLWPILRSEGFAGSGTTLRRLRSPLIHVVNVQGSSSWDRCYVNLGAHLDFLPAEGGVIVPPERFGEAHCAFRDRIDPPQGRSFAWMYVEGPAAVESIERAVEGWVQQGRPFFERHSGFPETFRRLVLDCDLATLHPMHALTHARIAIHLGESTRAAELARAGLASAPASASSIRSRLQKFLNTLS